MADNGITKLKILVASPGDVEEERQIVKEVIQQWNIEHGDRMKLWLEAVLWKSHAVPEMGDRGQGILNRQIVDQCDAAIGIFWTRIGTDTGVAIGGAVEEIERLREMEKPVMVYFSEAPFQRKKVDLEQLKKLDDYRQLLQSQGLVWQYETVDQFRKDLSTHLAMEVPKWFCGVLEESEVIPPPPTTTNVDLFNRYQASVVAALDHLLPPAVQSFSAKVSDVFVSLRLSGQQNFTGEQSSNPEQVMNTLFENNERLLLVIGDPGSGKTTLLQHYALSCRNEELCKTIGFNEPVMVFYLPLRELKKGTIGYAPLPANIFAWSEDYSLTIPENFFSESLHNRKTLVLLDGLDEISKLEERKSVCEWIRKSVNSFTKAIFIVTSRPTGYRPVDKIDIKPPLLRADILDFNPEQQKTFLYQWFTAVSPGQQQHAIDRADALLTFFAKEHNKSLRQMAGIPVLLQIMALLWKQHDTLSPNRAMLYESALEYLLEYQYEQKKIKPILSVGDAVHVLAPVSLWMQETLKSDEAEKSVMENEVQQALKRVLPEEHLLAGKDFCRDMVDRAGLLVEYGKHEYLFRHKSFREYLAGVQLKEDRPYEQLSTLVDNFGEDWWTEPLRFFIASVDAQVFDQFMEKLFNSPVSEAMTTKQQLLLQTIIEEAPHKKVDALCTKLLDPKIKEERQRVILDCLKTIGKPTALPALELFRTQELEKESTKNKDVLDRSEDVIIALGGKALERLSEKSISGKSLSLRNPNEQNAEYILIQGGNYWYSAMKKAVDVADCYVAKYPVTNKLYRSFIGWLGGKDSGQNHASAFREKLERIATGNDWGSEFGDYLKGGEDDLAALFRSENDEDRKFGGDNQPVVGVTWYAARAYCLWLSMLEESAGHYRLANEIEWEWAAGGRQGTTGQKVREYPWPEEKGRATPKLLNFRESNIGATTPVGSYPEGATPEGLYDMAGNVDEWCCDWYGDDGTFTNPLGPETGSGRVLRGGGWSYAAGGCRSAYRDRDAPGNRYNDVGFRLVFVP